MILQPGLRESDFDTPAKRAAILRRAQLGIPPTILLPQGLKNRAENWKFVRDVAIKTGSGWAAHFNFGSVNCFGNDTKTGFLLSPTGDESLWQQNKQWWTGELGRLAAAMWGAVIPERRDPPLRAVVVENEWRKNAKTRPVEYYQVPPTMEMAAAIDRRWTDHFNALSVLGPSLNIICYGRGTSDPPVFFGGEGAQGNHLDVGKNFYHVGQHGIGVIDDQIVRLKNAAAKSTNSFTMPPTTAWVTLGLGYDKAGTWHDDGEELYKPAVSQAIGRGLRGHVDHVLIYRAANERHRDALLRGLNGPARRTLKGSQ